jgi:type I restriction enzyme M protein
MPANYSVLEKNLWDAADDLRANSKLRSSDYSTPVLGLIFLCFADHRFAQAEREFAQTESSSRRRRTVGKLDYQARGVLFLPDEARFSKLILLPEGEDIGKALNEAMKLIERENPELEGVLPKRYTSFGNDLLVSLMKTLNSIPMDMEGDVFGKIYEYFLGSLPRVRGRRGASFIRLRLW